MDNESLILEPWEGFIDSKAQTFLNPIRQRNSYSNTLKDQDQQCANKPFIMNHKIKPVFRPTMRNKMYSNQPAINKENSSMNLQLNRKMSSQDKLIPKLTAEKSGQEFNSASKNSFGQIFMNKNQFFKRGRTRGRARQWAKVYLQLPKIRN